MGGDARALMLRIFGTGTFLNKVQGLWQAGRGPAAERWSTQSKSHFARVIKLIKGGFIMIPRNEYPRPQFQREQWSCLNGEWQFEVDHGDSGLERGLKERDLTDKIIVPFCPESELSGIGNTDFMNAVWYRRTVLIPDNWQGKNVLLHFQAVDYDTTVWVNNIEVKRHRGGFTPFTCDLQGIANPGEEILIVVRARDPKNMTKPGGKQSLRYENHACYYTRTTGIWQSVWLEPVPEIYLKRPRITPDVGNKCFHLEQPVSMNRPGYELRAELSYDGKIVSQATTPADTDLAARAILQLSDKDVHFWEPGKPELYDLKLELLNESGIAVDAAKSYCGLRSVAIDGMKVKINGKSVFQRQVLDQGYYSDGILTAPTDAALEDDIKLSIDAGFNSARLHQKVFEERFLYHADKLGYLVWGEFGDWGVRENLAQSDAFFNQPYAAIITQWLEVLERDYSHPCIIGWCGLNETREDITDKIQAQDDMTRGIFLAAKAMDTSRPVLDASGYAHRVLESDIYDCHDYAQDPAILTKNQAGLADGKPFQNAPHWNLPYKGQPFFVSEFGGIKWSLEFTDSKESWGYGDTPKSLEGFYSRFEDLCNVLLDNPNMFGYCYTQLTDVFQEQNGIYTFDRKPKFDNDKLRKIQQRIAKIEIS
jgi:beta-galactosidase/beta-glucuronidase